EVLGSHGDCRLGPCRRRRRGGLLAAPAAAGRKSDQKRDPERNRERRFGSATRVLPKHPMPPFWVALSRGPYVVGAIRREAVRCATARATAVRSARAATQRAAAKIPPSPYVTCRAMMSPRPPPP